MNFAASPFEIKQLNDRGAIEGLLAGFGTLDSHGDRIDAKAFSRTLSERKGRPLPMLLYHDQHRPIGAWTEWQETREGLHVKGSLIMATRDAQEAHALAEAGVLAGLSIGYKTKAARRDDRTGERQLLDVDLHEGSLVTIPSNPGTRITSLKSIGSARDIAELLQEGGVSGRKAKHAAGLAWKSINQADDDEQAEAEARAILNASAARIAALGVRK